MFNNFPLVFKVTGESQIMRISLPNRPIEVGASLSFYLRKERSTASEKFLLFFLCSLNTNRCKETRNYMLLFSKYISLSRKLM